LDSVAYLLARWVFGSCIRRFSIQPLKYPEDKISVLKLLCVVFSPTPAKASLSILGRSGMLPTHKDIFSTWRDAGMPLKKSREMRLILLQLKSSRIKLLKLATQEPLNICS